MNGVLSRMIFPGFIVGIMLIRSATALFFVLVQPVSRTNRAARIDGGIIPLGDIPGPLLVTSNSTSDAQVLSSRPPGYPPGEFWRCEKRFSKWLCRLLIATG